MRIITRSALSEFWQIHPQSEQVLKTWFHVTKTADWNSPDEIRPLYPNAKLSFLRDNRVVFGLSGNKYRLVVKIEYIKKLVFIRYIGTHSEYDKIDANTI